MKIRLFRTLTLIAILALAISACGPNSQAAPKTPLRVAWSLWPGYYPMAIAQEKGFFKAHNVEVEPVFYAVYNNQPADLASGMVDGAMLTLSDTLFDSIHSSVKVVLVLDNSAGADQLVGAPGLTIDDLRGKRIGVQSSAISGQLLVRQMLTQAGVALTEVTLVDVPPEKVPGAIPALIDLGYTYDPFTAEALAKGGSVLFSSADAPGLIADVLAFRTEITRDRPEDVKAFIAAWQEAIQVWKDNPAEGNAIIAAATGLKPEEISSVGVDLFDLAANQIAFTKAANSTSVFFTAQQESLYLAGTGDVTALADLDFMLDPSFLK